MAHPQRTKLYDFVLSDGIQNYGVVYEMYGAHGEDLYDEATRAMQSKKVYDGFGIDFDNELFGKAIVKHTRVPKFLNKCFGGKWEKVMLYFPCNLDAWKCVSGSLAGTHFIIDNDMAAEAQPILRWSV